MIRFCTRSLLNHGLFSHTTFIFFTHYAFCVFPSVAAAPECEANGFSSQVLAGAILGTFLLTVLFGGIVIGSLVAWKRWKTATVNTSALTGVCTADKAENVTCRSETHRSPLPLFIGSKVMSSAKSNNNNSPACDEEQTVPQLLTYGSTGRADTDIYCGKLRTPQTRLPLPRIATSATHEAEVYTGRGRGVEPWMNRAWSNGSLDYSLQSLKESRLVTVNLNRQDPIGLGFNIYGSLTDGIYVQDITSKDLTRASELGLVHPGDRIMSFTVSMKNIAYEDALILLSYAAPYPVQLHLQKPSRSSSSSEKQSSSQSSTTSASPALRKSHSTSALQSMRSNLNVQLKTAVGLIDKSAGPRKNSDSKLKRAILQMKTESSTVIDQKHDSSPAFETASQSKNSPDGNKNSPKNNKNAPKDNNNSSKDNRANTGYLDHAVSRQFSFEMQRSLEAMVPKIIMHSNKTANFNNSNARDRDKPQTTICAEKSVPINQNSHATAIQVTNDEKFVIAIPEVSLPFNSKQKKLSAKERNEDDSHAPNSSEFVGDILSHKTYVKPTSLPKFKGTVKFASDNTNDRLSQALRVMLQKSLISSSISSSILDESKTSASLINETEICSSGIDTTQMSLLKINQKNSSSPMMNGTEISRQVQDETKINNKLPAAFQISFDKDFLNTESKEFTELNVSMERNGNILSSSRRLSQSLAEVMQNNARRFISPCATPLPSRSLSASTGLDMEEEIERKNQEMNSILTDFFGDRLDILEKLGFPTARRNADDALEASKIDHNFSFGKCDDLCLSSDDDNLSTTSC